MSAAKLTVPTRPGLLQRLRRWWQLGKLRATLGGTQADLVDNETLMTIARGQLMRSGPDTMDDAIAHFRHVLRDRQMLLARLAQLSAQAKEIECGGQP